jgi:hypothetical protein
VLLFHGNTMNFYVGAPRFLPPVPTRLGFACLAFNRRGHDILSIRDSRAAEGAAFQRRSAGSCDVEIYVRREAAICDLVSGWLARTLKILHFVIPAKAGTQGPKA